MRKIIGTGLIVCFAVIGPARLCGAHERVREYSAFNPANDFTLTDQDGDVFHLKDHRGKMVLLFFGYLSCPDVCPVTLSKLSRVYHLLEEEEEAKVLTAFVSVDPARDKVEGIKEYLTYFDVNATGLTGSQEEVDTVVEAYKASYEIVGEGSAMGYLINHTSYVYLIAPDGSVQYLFRPEDDAEHFVKIIRKIFKQKSNK